MLLSVIASFHHVALNEKSVYIIDRPSISSQTRQKVDGNNFACAPKFLAKNETKKRYPWSTARLLRKPYSIIQQLVIVNQEYALV